MAKRSYDVGFNPSDGLSVFQTCQHGLASHVLIQFQSLGWVERLSDLAFFPMIFGYSKFQSLGWVERLSDLA